METAVESPVPVMKQSLREEIDDITSLVNYLRMVLSESDGERKENLDFETLFDAYQNLQSKVCSLERSFLAFEESITGGD